MLKDAPGYSIWRTLLPLLLFFVFHWVAQFVVTTAVLVMWLPEIMSQMEEAQTTVALFQEELMRYLLQIGLYVQQRYGLLMRVLGAVFTFFYAFFAFRKDRKIKRESDVKVKNGGKAKYYALIVGFALVSSLVLNVILILLGQAFPAFAESQNASYLLSTPLWLQLLGLGLVIPIVEELVFRGLLFKRYQERYGFLGACGWSTLFFAFAHGNGGNLSFMYAFVMGLFLAYVYVKFGTIKAPVLFHIVINLLAVIMTYTQGLRWLFADGIRISVGVVLGTFLAASLFVLMQHSKIEKE
ncbi:MAG: CPBP family intramembrane metalloprotease [Lachnospiraceae bacterium]|nr:CPBP family intramembrane metalloprotease [Lachnospiraceae bacterium]